ncbi:putative oxidoreductase [Kitasatospora setae KM-6054]|uniref:Putative oxidoreductase n=1 Tax=Kitasatospora setae (strain ATCC 33774 / DSM 43861 / JCM 3304 / KCC A-0304 / NBRC 14216 / KM-6054) TaxID=452652 RepID=E4N926_KITSK|nr:putative oxidoreductase [Kitasatospora setae KM-6054]
MPETVHEIRLARRAQGRPVAADLEVVEVPAPQPEEGQVLLRNRWFVLYPGLATLLGDTPPNTPFPSVPTGGTLFGPAVAEVLHAPAGSGLRTGDLVSHVKGWREYAVAEPAELTLLDGVLPDPAAYLAPGSVGYAALALVSPVRPGETVLVTGAGGAVGTLAGQTARLLGAGTVLGTTGSPAKAAALRQLGYDAVLVDERTAPTGDGSDPGSDSDSDSGSGRAERFAEQLAAAAPDGIDVLLDTVGGHQAEAALAAARPGARASLIGVLSGQFADAPGHSGRPAQSVPLRLDAFQLIVRGIRVAGHGSEGHAAAQAAWLPRFGDWLRTGRITFPHTRITGLDQAPRAFQEMTEGRYLGTVLVEL